MKTIIFDERCAAWTKDIDYDLMFLETQGSYIKEIFVHRGYIYLNQIYEYFGVEWNPNLVNPCYRLTSGQLRFEFEPVSSAAIMVKIC